MIKKYMLNVIFGFCLAFTIFVCWNICMDYLEKRIEKK